MRADRMTSLTSLSRKYKVVLLGGVVTLVLFAVSAVTGSWGWVHLRRLYAQQESLEAMAFHLERENAKLREHLRRLETDDAYLEKLARERLGWIRPGDLVYRVSAEPSH